MFWAGVVSRELHIQGRMIVTNPDNNASAILLKLQLAYNIYT